MVQIMKKNNKSSLMLSLFTFALLFLTGCENMFHKPVKEWFEKYTDTAAIEKHEFSSLAVKNPSGVMCIPSGDDQEIKLYLRNPQSYELEMHYIYDNENFEKDEGVSFAPDLSVKDYSIYTITFNANKLKLIDGKTTADAKNQYISGLITLTESKFSGRSFDSYPLTLNVNSAPLAVKNAMLQLANEGSGNYILCFHAPVTDGTVHSDIKKIIINGNSYDYSSGSVSDAEFSSSRTVYPLNDGGFNFSNTAPSGYTPLYFDTGIDMEENGTKEVRYTITLQDEGGLSTTSYISTTAEKLCEPVINIEDTNAADEETGYFTFTITHNGKSFIQHAGTDESGTPVIVTEEHSCGAVTVNYSIKKSGGTEIYKSGSTNGTATIKLPKGVYAITTWATKPYYVASDEESVSDKKVIQNAVFYVSETGSDEEGTGARSYPYRTIQKALDVYKEGIPEYYDADSKCEIRVVSNLTAPEDFWTSTPAPTAFIQIPSLASAKIKITGWGGIYTIDAGKPSDSQIIYAATSSMPEVNIENIKFTGADTGVHTWSPNIFAIKNCEFHELSVGLRVGGGNPELTNVKIHDNKVNGIVASTNGGVLKCINCSIYKNGLAYEGTEENNGGGIVIASAGKVILYGGSVSENSATKGGGIFNAGTLTLDGSTEVGAVTITGNNASIGGGGIYYSEGTLNLKGVVKVTGNTKPDAIAESVTSDSNLYMPITNKLTIDGDITGSKIGINVPWNSDLPGAPAIGKPVEFTKNYDFGSVNNVKPGVIFKAENSYGIAPFKGEASFAVSSGAMYTSLDYNFTFELKDAAGNMAYGFMPGKGAVFTIIPKAFRSESTLTDPIELYYKAADKKLYENYDSETEAYSDVVADGAEVKFTASLWNGSYKVKDLTVSLTDDDLTVSVPEVINGIDNYVIKVSAEYLGITHDANFNLVCNNCAENAASYIAGLKTAGTYSVKVEYGVESGIDNAFGNETKITSDDKGLSKVAKMIRLKSGSGIYIKLDASKTTAVSDIETYNEGEYFKNCTTLQEIILPDWLEYVIPNLFKGCTGLTNITLTENTKKICESAFENCTNLTTITLPDGVTEIEASAFKGCTKLAAVNMPATVKKIGSDAFNSCSSLNKVNFTGEKRSWGKIKRPSTAWHYGAAQTSDTTGSVYCTDGRCGLDYVYSYGLTFEAIEAGAKVTFTNKAAGAVKYKINDDDSSEVTIGSGASKEITLANAGDYITFYGNNSKYYNSDTDKSSISCDKDCYIYGNVMSLVDAENYDKATTLTAENSFRELFKDNTKIKNKASEPLKLGATTLTANCYEAMFDGCTGLTSTPSLPATTLKKECYKEMFKGCTSLTSSPVLPATTLAESCYEYMFNVCTSLAAASEIKATTLAKRSCFSMFDGCSALTTVPELKATTLTDTCYFEMFKDCTSLVNPPVIKATTTAFQSCYGMFWGCANLTAAPELKATTLAEQCYSHMFKGCTSLTTVPDLNATTLAEDCYSNMFRGCTSLETAPEIKATTLARNSCDGMFKECSALTAAPELKATILAEDCYRAMFYECTSLTEAPELKAETLVKECYEYMFYGCTKLESITCRAKNISAEDCLKKWVMNVRPSGVFTQASGVTYETGESGIPEGWLVLGGSVSGTPLTLEAVSSAATITFKNKASGVVAYIIKKADSDEEEEAKVVPSGETKEIVLEGAGDKVTLFGTNSAYGVSNSSNCSKINCSAPCYIYGNIMSLTNGTNFASATALTADYTFAYLFEKNANIQKHPSEYLVLPATTLKENCYRYMFSECTGLTSIPVETLSATSLVKSCYYGMFRKSGITEIPSDLLPATTLAESCYSYMFKDCTNLTILPAELLPATTLTKQCYGYMFSGCTNIAEIPLNIMKATTLGEGSCYYMFNKTGITTIPSGLLNATALAKECYKYMFSECKQLETVPSNLLPATSLAEGCYSQMFYNCSKLTNVPVLNAKNLEQSCYNEMFKGCTSLESIPALPATTLKNNCYAHMFEGCKGLTSVNVNLLKATAATYACYDSMFKGCENLKNAPNLPATSLQDNCYAYMFEGCKKLKEMPVLPASKVVYRCYRGMFKDCTSLTEMKALNATLDIAFVTHDGNSYGANECYSEMFSGCTGLTSAVKLPSTKLDEECYSKMFYNCTSLKTVPSDMLPAKLLISWADAPDGKDVYASGAYKSMFSGCTNLENAPDLPTETLYYECCVGMFYRCKNINSIKCLASKEAITSFTESSSSIDSCFKNWVSGVSSTGTFIIKSGTQSAWPRGVSGIPNGWTIVEQ